MDDPAYCTQPDEELVQDVLFCRRMKSQGCIVLNLAAADLECCGASVLPTIESVVESEVEGNCSVVNNNRCDEFPGLLSLMRSYFKISDRFSLHCNAVKFLYRISTGTRLNALDAICRLVYWEKPLPDEYHHALRDILPEVTSSERDIIERIIGRHYQRRWWQKWRNT